MPSCANRNLAHDRREPRQKVRAVPAHGKPKQMWPWSSWRSTQNLAAGSPVFAALYLLSHGLVKIGLVWEILRNRFWAHLGLICLTLGFMIRATDLQKRRTPNFLAI